MPTTTSSTSPSRRAIRLTPPGVAALAVVRLVGAGLDEFLSKHFRGRPAPGRCAYGKIVDHADQTIDDVIVVRLPGSEPAADITLHGGSFIVDAFLNLARTEGFAICDRAGAPAPLDAVDGDTVIEREVTAHLPLAMTDLAVQILTAQPENWTRLQQEIEAGTVSVDQLRQVLRNRALWRLLHGPRVAIIGVPNAGKSTLSNALFGRQRSLTADVPGTTRDWVGDIADLDGLAVRLIDTPGLRAASDPIEADAIHRARRVLKSVYAMVLVLDPAQPSPPQQSLLAQYPTAVLVANKTDRPAIWQPPAQAIPTVATIGQGIDALRTALRRKLGCDALDAKSPRCWTQRQRHWLIDQINSPHRLGRRG